MHRQRIESEKGHEEKIKCPLSDVVVVRCPVTSCMWHDTKSKGNCAYRVSADETDLGQIKGLSIEDSALQARRAKASIQKILVLDKYVDFIRSRVTKEQEARLKDLVESDVFLVSLREKTQVWNDLFHMNMAIFVEACRKKQFKDFVKENKAIASYKVSSLLGLRESMLEKVDARYRSLMRKNTRSGNKEKSSKGK